MSLESAEIGESVQDLKRHFKKKVIEGGSLKGAHYLDIGPADLAKAARSYRGDSRFQQFAKRMVAARTLSQEGPKPLTDALAASSSGGNPQSFFSKFKAWFMWALVKLRGRVWWSLLVIFVLSVFFTRPRLYVVLRKLVTVSIKLLIRYSMGALSVLFDAVLDELSFQLDSAVGIAAVEPQTPVPVVHTMPPPTQVQPHSDSFTALALNLLCIIVGTIVSPLLGQHWPRAQVPPRNPPH